MGIWYRNDSGEFAYTDIPEFIKYHECMQELQQWKYENSFYQNNGIDYYGIINRRTFINLEFEKVLDKHRSNFESIEATYNETEKGQKLSITIKFVFHNGEIITNNFDLQF